MVATYAQRQASKNYTNRQKQKGFCHHTVFCTDKQWLVIKPFISLMKNINIDAIDEVTMDENGVAFIYSENLAKETQTNTQEVEDYTETETTPAE